MYIGTSDDKVLLSLNPATGVPNWKAPVKFNVFGSCSFTRKMCYASTLMGKVVGIDQQTGAIRWTWTTDNYEANKLKYFTADDEYRDDIGSVLEDGGFLKLYYTVGAIFSCPYIKGDRMFISSTNGKLYCLKRR